MLENNAGFRCENCNKIFPTANVTYTITALISDMSGSTFVSFLSENGDSIMGVSAVDFKQMKEETHTFDEMKDYC